MPNYDNVNRPKQYNLDKLSIQDGKKYDKSIEPIDYIERLLTGHDFSGFEGAMVKDIIKYVSRFPFKGQRVEDLEKAQFYLERLIAHEKEYLKDTSYTTTGNKELSEDEAKDVAQQVSDSSDETINTAMANNVEKAKNALEDTSDSLKPVDVSKVKNHMVE